MPFGFFAALAGSLILPVAGGRDRHITNGCTIRAVTDLGVASKITNQNHFIDRGHADLRILKNYTIHQCPVGLVPDAIMGELANRRQPQNYAIETVYGTF
jgi:hypothetical protein